MNGKHFKKKNEAYHLKANVFFNLLLINCIVWGCHRSYTGLEKRSQCQITDNSKQNINSQEFFRMPEKDHLQNYWK